MHKRRIGTLVVIVLIVGAVIFTARRNTPPPAATPAARIDAPPPIVDDPAADGWETELLNERAGKQLKRIAAWLADPADKDIADIADEAFASSAIRAKTAPVVFDAKPIRVERTVRFDHDSPATGFMDAMHSLRKPFENADHIHAKLKIYRIELSDGTFTTKLSASVAGVTEAGPLEENANWRCAWTVSDPPKLLSLTVLDHERTQIAADRPLFADCTEAVLQRRMAEDDLLGYGLNHWNVRIPAMYGQVVRGYHGLAVGDANGDGLDDVYLCHPGGMPNQLFIQNSDGTLTDRAAEAGVDWMEETNSALFVDLDNDGDQDLVLASRPQGMMLENTGDGKFVGRRLMLGPNVPTSMAAADPDRDGDLDLYVCYYAYNTPPIPYHDANNGPRNIYWRNEGGWRFTDATGQVGLDQNDSRFSFDACFEDYDNDGDVDLYVANDYGRNNLYRNNGNGTFADVAAEAGVEDVAAGMSATFGDYDRDGVMDLYVSNMYSTAGNRITTQSQFNPLAQGEDRAELQRHARGNSLFKGLAGGTFQDVSVDAGVTMGRWAWGSLFVDINNDSLQDLIVANGYLTNEDTKDL